MRHHRSFWGHSPLEKRRPLKEGITLICRQKQRWREIWCASVPGSWHPAAPLQNDFSGMGIIPTRLVTDALPAPAGTTRPSTCFLLHHPRLSLQPISKPAWSGSERPMSGCLRSCPQPEMRRSQGTNAPAPCPSEGRSLRCTMVSCVGALSQSGYPGR